MYILYICSIFRHLFDFVGIIFIKSKILLDFKIGVEGLLTAYPEIFFIVYVILTN